jgi:hypothetical protein
MDIKFIKSPPAAMGPVMFREDLISWWRKLPGVAERHRKESAPRTEFVRRSRGRVINRYVPGVTVWHDTPSTKTLAQRYAKAHGACVWVCGDGDCFAFWYIGGKIVSRRGHWA